MFLTERHSVVYALLLLLFSTGYCPIELIDTKKKTGQDVVYSDNNNGENTDIDFIDTEFGIRVHL
jgi:hypothetical protein